MSGSIAAYGEGYNFTKSYAAVSASTPEFPGAPLAVGTRVVGTAGAEWVFVIAGGTVAAGDVCLITTNATWTASAATSTLAKGKLGQMVGVAGAAATVGQFFWLQIAGYNASVNATTGQAAHTVLSSTATAGRIGVAVGGASAKVTGLVLLATAASNAAPAILTNPAVGTDD
jgi:hypothetical protein